MPRNKEPFRAILMTARCLAAGMAELGLQTLTFSRPLWRSIGPNPQQRLCSVEAREAELDGDGAWARFSSQPQGLSPVHPQSSTVERDLRAGLSVSIPSGDRLGRDRVCAHLKLPELEGAGAVLCPALFPGMPFRNHRLSLTGSLLV